MAAGARNSAALVQRWKKKTGHSNASAAAVFGVHPRTFARWLSGESTPDDTDVERKMLREAR